MTGSAPLLPDPGAPALLAHSGPATPETLWHLDPASGLALAGVAVVVLVVLRAALGRGRTARTAEDRSRLLGLAGGLGLLGVTMLSPLHGLADALFSAHMVQHLLLLAVIAPLLARSRPVVAPGLRWPDPAPSWLVPAATAGLVVVFCAWHVPALYELAVREPLVHGLEHATMLGAGAVYWTAVAGAARERVLVAVGAIAASGLVGVALGALLALAPEPWYEVHAVGAAAWDVDLLADQQLGGMIMWVPAGAANLAAAVLLLFRVLDRLDRGDAAGELDRLDGREIDEPVRPLEARASYPGGSMSPPPRPLARDVIRPR